MLQLENTKISVQFGERPATKNRNILVPCPIYVRKCSRKVSEKISQKNCLKRQCQNTSNQKLSNQKLSKSKTLRNIRKLL
jgi:hypothetical protein